MTIKNIICIFGLLSIQIGSSQNMTELWGNQHLTQIDKEAPNSIPIYDDTQQNYLMC